jgi:RNA polymerase sigma-70 factor (ECF subfamily)
MGGILTMQEITEDALIARSKQGDQEAIGELFGRHYSRSLKQATGILRHHDDAQDAVQAAYFRAFRRLDNFRGEASFKTWITRIVVNCCLLQLREARRRVTWVQLDDRNRPLGLDALASHTPTPDKIALSEEIEGAVSLAVSKLPMHLKEAYTLFTISELSLQEVASSLGLTLSATKTRLFRARAGIRTSLRPFCLKRNQA